MSEQPTSYHPRSLHLLGGLLMLIVALPQAAQELVTDRPDFTESALTVPHGRVQVEGGASFEDFDRGEAAGEALAVGELLVRIGVGERLELRLAPGSYERFEPRRGAVVEGWGDASLGLKWALPEVARLFPSGSRPDVALLADAELPTGGDEVGEDGVRPGAVLALGWDLSARFGLGVNVGYRRARDEGRRFDQGSASVAAGWAVDDRVSLFAEWFALSELEPGGEAAHHLDGGVTWLLNDDLQFDAFVGVGVSAAAPDHFAGIGFAARF